ncbi:MAG TPA: ATP-binding protein [Candidatus Acidoferrum sp.]|nr:ATP-binding protein [Candidatus Acidoferrum sp.]
MSSRYSDIKKTVEGEQQFVQWFAEEVLLGKNWVKKLLFIDTIVFLVFNPSYFPKVLHFFGLQSLPHWYPIVFWFLVGLIFLAAIIVAVHAHSRTQEQRFRSEPGPIKGLLPFGFEDAEVFARLQRHRILTDCLQAVNDANYRFGILTGESGSGKTSFLQAGLWPALNNQGYGCVYARFSDVDPLVSIRQALASHLKVPIEDRSTPSFSTLADLVENSSIKSTLFLFDQFEQFFVHRRRRSERQPFVRDLADWYRARPQSRVKILVCVRRDFVDSMIDFQKAMGYSLGPQDIFSLEKFEVEEAIEVFRVLAESEAMSFDEGFVRELAQNELARQEDALVSPADIQIFAWMISGQRKAEDRTFDRRTYQKLGGVEGLLERFLGRALDARGTEGRTQIAIKVLIALTDFDRNTRMPIQPLASIISRVEGRVSETEVSEAVQWLARSDVRLVSASEVAGVQGYELAHERLIPALRRLVGKELSKADQATQLLERRLNEWLGNRRSPRYLLSWSEWRLAQKHLRAGSLGPRGSLKEDFLAKSRNRLLIRVGLTLLPVVMLCSFAGWWNSRLGATYRVDADLRRYSEAISDDFGHAKMAQGLAESGWIEDGLRAFSRIRNPNAKVGVLPKISEAAEELGKEQVASVLLDRALERMPSKGARDELDASRTVVAVASAVVKLRNPAEAKRILDRALVIAQSIQEPRERVEALAAVAGAEGQRGDPVQGAAILQNAVPDLGKVGYDATGKFAEAASKLRDGGHVWPVFNQVLQTFPALVGTAGSHSKANLLSSMCASAEQVEDPKGGLIFLRKALTAAYGISNPFDKVHALAAIAKADAKAGDAAAAAAVLRTALTVLGKVENRFTVYSDPSPEDFAIRELAQATGTLENIEQAEPILQKEVHVAEQIKGALHRARALSEVGAAAARLGNPRQAQPILQAAVREVEGLDPGFLLKKPEILALIAAGSIGLKDDDQSAVLMQEVLKVTDRLGALPRGMAVREIGDALDKEDTTRASLVMYRALDSAAWSGGASEEVRALAAIVLQAGFNQAQRRAATLEQALQSAANIGYPECKAWIVEVSARVASGLPSTGQVRGILRQALNVARTLDWPEKQSALNAIIQASTNLGEVDLAHAAALSNDSDKEKAESLVLLRTSSRRKKLPFGLAKTTLEQNVPGVSAGSNIPRVRISDTVLLSAPTIRLRPDYGEHDQPDMERHGTNSRKNTLPHK